MSVPCTSFGLRTLSRARTVAPLRWLRSAILRSPVGPLGMAACVVLCGVAVVVAAEEDKLEFTAGNDSPEDVFSEAKREIISAEANPATKIEQPRPKASFEVLPEVTESGARSLLMRKWDLNADGRIDEREANVARARLRRERMDIQRQGGNDPLTGRPRGEKEQAQVVADGAGGRGEYDEESAEMPAEADDDSPRLPGTTPPRLAMPVPTARSPVIGPPQGIPRASIYTRPQGGQQQSSSPPGSPARQQPDTQAGPQTDSQAALGSRAGWTGRWTQPLTGGARAGAPAATAGYGASGPQRDLNAGRYREELPSLRGLTPRLDVSGGLLPTVRQPRPPVATPPPKPPRITAEDIGGY